MLKKHLYEAGITMWSMSPAYCVLLQLTSYVAIRWLLAAISR